MTSITDFLERWFARQPNQRLFEFRDARGVLTEYHTYKSFYERTLLISSRLNDAGLNKGDRVLLAYPAGLEGIAALLACARIGLIGVPVPLPWSVKDASYQRLLAVGIDCGATVLLSHGAHVARLRDSISMKHPCFANLRFLNSADFSTSLPAQVLRDDGDVFFLQYTSGSTGQPRGVIVTHSNVIANARATIDHVPLGVSWLPHHHDMGLIGYYLFPIVTGGANVGFAPLDFLRRPALWLRLISEVGATYSSAPNFGYDYCLRDGKIKDEDLDGVDLSSLRVLMNASEPASVRTLAQFQKRFSRYGLRSNACTVAYGLAENTLTVTHGGRESLRLERHSFGLRRAIPADSGVEDKDAIDVACCGNAPPGIEIRIYDSAQGRQLDDLMIGEIQVAGASVTLGYWNNVDLTDSVFGTAPQNTGMAFGRYIRTGDLGFLQDGRLYVCGRTKDLIIVGGVNFYPSDIEAAVAASIQAARIGGSCAFQMTDGRVVVLVEAAHFESIPDPRAIAQDIRAACSLVPHLVSVVAAKAIAKTTSGKIARSDTRERFVANSLNVLASYETGTSEIHCRSDKWRTQLRMIFHRFGALNDVLPLADHGIDSLSLVELQIEVENLLLEMGAGALIESMNGILLQRLSLADLLSALAPLDRGLTDGISQSLNALSDLQASIDKAVDAQMRHDSRWTRRTRDISRSASASGEDILLTGGTGFFGPFLLSELLHQTTANIHVLVRAGGQDHAFERIEAALAGAHLLTIPMRQILRKRVRPVCGDLSKPYWGLSSTAWLDLAHSVREIFHNGACVNYVMTYEAMRATNVEGVRTALDLAAEGRGRPFHLISSTFIFGWTPNGVLLETDRNPEMLALDFGYSQSKWVAEQLAFAASASGVDVRIYRPALISVSSSGAGDPNDVAVRILAFMIKHGIAVDTPNQLSILPADVIAHNIVGISQLGSQCAPALHVTADRYYSMKDLTQIISRDFGCHFEYYDILGFIEQINRRCSPQDPVYPLLDFFNRSADKMAAMQLKRYSNLEYQNAQSKLLNFRAAPSLEETARYVMRYLKDQKLIGTVAAKPVETVS